MDGRRVTLTPGTTLRFVSLDFVHTRLVEPVSGRTFTRPPHPNVLTGAAGHEAFVRGFSDDVILGMLGPNPTQERFRLAAYYLTDLAFQASGDAPLGWGEFMECYTAMYPRGLPGLPDDSVTAYVNNLRAIGTAPGSATTRGTRTTRRHDPTRECNVCMASSSSSSEPEPASRHHGADDQRRAWLDELAEARRQLEEELALLRQELGVDAEPRDRQPAQDIPVQGEPPRGMATGASTARLQTSRMTAHLRRRHVGQSSTTTDAPMEARMSTRTPTLTLRHFSGGRLKTLPLRTCYCAAA
jgi:hypothetical protein